MILDKLITYKWTLAFGPLVLRRACPWLVRGMTTDDSRSTGRHPWQGAIRAVVRGSIDVISIFWAPHCQGGNDASFS